MRLSFLLVLPALFIAGCRGGAEPETTGPLAVDPMAKRDFKAPGSDAWVLTWDGSRTEANALLWNGLIGVRLGPGAMGSALNGAELPAFDIGKYQQDGEEKILPQPNPLLLAWKVGGIELAPSSPTDYKQVLDLKSGLVVTTWSQETLQGGETRVRVETLLHPASRVIADRWEIQPSQPCQVSYTAVPGSWNSSNFFAVEPRPMAGESVYRPAGNTGAFDLAANQALVLERVIGLEPSTRRWSELRSEVEGAWANRWETDIEIDGPVEDQQAVRSWIFYLRSAIHPDSDMSISPMGLSSAQYNGHVFWDADVWVFPALALIDPELAKEIPEYRLAKLQQARRNFEAWSKERPIGNGRSLGGIPIFGILLGAKFPWESSVTGMETVPGPSRFQDHITGTTAFGVKKAATLGLVEQEAADDLLRDAASFFQYRREEETGPDGVRQWVIKDTMSPDEYHTGDNDLYTNLIAQWIANGGNWQEAADKPSYKLPKDDQTFLTYDNDTVRSYKQAAAVLAIYPLQYPPAEAQAKEMMERFADKVTDNGPAMTDSVHALIWARLGETDKAYETWQKSWKEFSYPPHLLFSEKRRSEKTYFTTGAGGCLQTVIYGFLGFRIDSEQLSGAAWSTQLKGGNWLSIKPNLPKAWKKVTFKNFKVLGKSYTVTATHDSVQVTEGA